MAGQRMRLAADDRAVYEGEVRSLPHGRRKETHPDGSVYEGEWCDGEPHGQGKESFPDGGVYEGGFLDDDMHGQGRWTHPEHGVYEDE